MTTEELTLLAISFSEQNTVEMVSISRNLAPAFARRFAIWGTKLNTALQKNKKTVLQSSRFRKYRSADL